MLYKRRFLVFFLFFFVFWVYNRAWYLLSLQRRSFALLAVLGAGCLEWDGVRVLSRGIPV